MVHITRFLLSESYKDTEEVEIIWDKGLWSNNATNNSKKRAKPTIEFRQHSGTTNYAKIEAWVRFCTAFCQHSMERPQKLKHYEDPFESLFDTVIQDIRLKDYYRSRRNQLFVQHQNYNNDRDHDDQACCDSCGKEGGTCQG